MKVVERFFFFYKVRKGMSTVSVQKKKKEEKITSCVVRATEQDLKSWRT